MMLIVLIFILLIFYNINKDRNISHNISNSPVLKLKERYINGDIDEDTYLKMLDVLRK